MQTSRIRLRALIVASAAIAFAALPFVASATTVDGPGYNCEVGQVSGPFLAAQFCEPFGGAPGNGLIIVGGFTVNIWVFNGTPGVARCAAPIPLVPLSGVVSTSSNSVQIIGLDCVRIR